VDREPGTDDLSGRMIEATQDKLDEARFFLRRLRREADKTSTSEEEEPDATFGHYFSAFVSAARSVPYALQAEEKEKYDAWIDQWDASLGPEDKDLLKFMHQRRLDEIHRKGAKTGIARWERVSIFNLPVRTYRVSGRTWHQRLALSGATPLIYRAIHQFKEGGQPEVIAECQRWLDYLEKLVGAFLQAHK
jgi:hypothetical protein